MTATPEQWGATVRSQIGTREDPAGSNDTVYGAWYGWNGVAWCVIFFMWVAWKVGEVLPIKTASVVELNDFCEAHNLLVPRGQTPKEGDGVLRTWTGKGRHQAGFNPDETHCQEFLGTQGTAWNLAGGNQNDPSGGVVSFDTSSGWNDPTILNVIDTERFLAHGAANGTAKGTAHPSPLSPSHPNPLPLLFLGQAVSGQTTHFTKEVQQHACPGDVDGVYGPKTEQAVKDWQHGKNLVIDGVVGQLTYKSMGITS